MKLKPYSAAVLTFCGVALIGVGSYFIFLRPVLLPEDARYIGASLQQLQATAPNLLQWLSRVFWVMGGYVLTTGLLTLYVARTSFRKRAHGVSVLVALAGLTSVGWMTIVNFVIQSDFKWFLLGLTGLWGISLLLFWIEGKISNRAVT